MIDDYKILLSAILDAKAKGDLKKQLKNMDDLSITISKLNLDPSAIKDVKNQLSGNGIDINLVFGNTKQLQSQAKQTGRQIGQIVSDSAQQLDLEMRKSGNLELSWADKLNQQWKTIGGKSIATGSLTLMLNQLKKMPQEVYEIDTAMTSLYKVTDETSAKYDLFLASAAKSAQELGRSISSLIEQTSAWVKLGYSFDDSAKLAEATSVYANVGGIDDKTAVSNIATALKSFNIAASDSMQIIDKISKLGNDFTTSSAELGQGLNNSASALSFAGNDINESLAMITAMNTLTRDADESGNAVKVLSMRLRGMKSELDALGESTDGIESITKLQAQLLNLSNNKVNIFNDQGSLKSTYDIMSDIANVWDSISKTDQTQMLELIASKQRSGNVEGLIKSFQSGQVDEAFTTALSSDGFAMQAQEQWLDSLQAKLLQLEAAFQSLSNTTLDSNLMKVVVDIGTSLVNTLDSIIDKFGLLIPLISGGSVFEFFKNFDWLCNKSCLKIA